MQRYVAQQRAKVGWVPSHRGFDSHSPGHKATLCRFWMERGRCARGDACGFAHGVAELEVHCRDDAQFWAQIDKYGLDYPGSSGQGGGSGSGSNTAPRSAASHSQTKPAAHVGNPATSHATLLAQSSASNPSLASLTAEQLADLQLVDDEDDDLPEAFLCPITQVRLRDPVVAADGYTYERDAIEAWLSGNGTSPMNNLPLEDKSLVPNLTLMTAMDIVLGS
jgi:hypothetical protein